MLFYLSMKLYEMSINFTVTLFFNYVINYNVIFLDKHSFATKNKMVCFFTFLVRAILPMRWFLWHLKDNQIKFPMYVYIITGSHCVAFAGLELTI